ncbi:MAG: Orn/Lys/Arg decarboxylase N-terminal domain-containing protein, partial [Yersiniaceae bacterium]|nr:Orn/Lys/Arg decarboxylase N-terminal domain-containing protein [Yersiniaceae bacterium]
MKSLKIAASAGVAPRLDTPRDVIALESADYTEVAAIVVSADDLRAGRLEAVQQTGFAIPAFVAVSGDETVSPDYLPHLKGVFSLSDANQAFYGAQLEAAAAAYEAALFPPFFDTLKKYVEMQNSTFAC